MEVHSMPETTMASLKLPNVKIKAEGQEKIGTKGLKVSKKVPSSAFGKCATVGKSVRLQTKFGRKLCKHKDCGRDVSHDTGFCTIHHDAHMKRIAKRKEIEKKRTERRRAKNKGKKGRGKNRSKTKKTTDERSSYSMEEMSSTLDLLLDNMQEGEEITLSLGPDGASAARKRRKSKK